VVPKNVLDLWPEIFGVVGGAIILIGAALAFSFRHRSGIRPGSAGHRPEEQQGESEIISPDGYIDSFGGVIEEAGGGLPLMGKLIIAFIAICYVVYLIVYWTPR